MWNSGDSTLKAVLAQAPGKGILRGPHSSPDLSHGCVLPVWLACFMGGGCLRWEYQTPGSLSAQLLSLDLAFAPI